MVVHSKKQKGLFQNMNNTEIKDTKEAEVKEESTEQVETKTSKEEAKANYANAKLRIVNEGLREEVAKLTKAVADLTTKNSKYEFEQSKAAFQQEYKKLGGKPETFDAFCKLYPNIIKQNDTKARKEAIDNAVKEVPFMFNKTFIATIPGVQTKEGQETKKGNDRFYFDKNGVYRSRY